MDVERRTLLAASLAAAGAALLGGCSRKTDVEKIAEANAAIIAKLDPAQTRLPLGSVVETALGRFMVAGHKCVLRKALADGTAVRKAFDYYGVAWPLGIEFPESEGLAGAVFNVADIASVAFVGLVNEEDRDMRDYISAWDITGSNPDVVTGAPMEWVRYSELRSLEQQLRLQGATCSELYGEGFSGGLLFSSEG